MKTLDTPDKPGYDKVEVLHASIAEILNSQIESLRHHTVYPGDSDSTVITRFILVIQVMYF